MTTNKPEIIILPAPKRIQTELKESVNYDAMCLKAFGIDVKTAVVLINVVLKTQS